MKSDSEDSFSSQSDAHSLERPKGKPVKKKPTFLKLNSAEENKRIPMFPGGLPESKSTYITPLATRLKHQNQVEKLRMTEGSTP
jgi:hypothetical protein